MKHGKVPNVDMTGKSKPVFYTPDEVVMSGSEAQAIYNLKEPPTHAVGLDTSGVTSVYGSSPVEGSISMHSVEIITRDEIRALYIIRLR